MAQSSKKKSQKKQNYKIYRKSEKGKKQKTNKNKKTKLERMEGKRVPNTKFRTRERYTPIKKTENPKKNTCFSIRTA